MKRWIFLAVGLAILGSTPASAVVKLKPRKEPVRPPVTSPIPEPTAALVFGTSLLVIGLSKRRRSDR